VSLVLGAGLLGCSAGGGEAAASSHTAITSLRAHAVAAAINLERSDFPASANALPQPDPTKERRESLAEERRCYGITIPAWADLVSDSFFEHTGHGSRVITSQVIIRRSPADAQSDLSRSRSHRAQLCFARELRRALARIRFHDLGRARPTLGPTVVSPLAVSASGADGSVAWRYVTGLNVGPVKFSAYQDVVTFAYGQDQVFLVSFGIREPYPIERQRSLVSFLLERARLHTR
jgi:hypothetical protein